MPDIKKPASERCNRNHPRSPNQRRKKRQEEATARQAEYDVLTWTEKVLRWANAIKNGHGDGKKQKFKFAKMPEDAVK